MKPPLRAALLASALLAPIGRPPCAIAGDLGPAPPRMEVVFVLDTTGSMGGMLEAAKQQIWSIVTELACARPAPDLRLGLVAYRDRGDDYVTRALDLTPDMDALYTELVGLEAGGGGDGPESVNQALHEAVTLINWSRDARTYRAIFLVGDAPPHMNYPDDVVYGHSCARASERGITVNAIQCGNVPGTLPIWTDIARRGGGTLEHLADGGAAPPITTPWDAGMAAMAKQLDDTRLAYGSDAERAAGAERRARAERISAGGTAAVLASRGDFNATASGRRSLYGANDLLTAWQSGAVRIEDLDDARLPEPLRALSPSERRTYLENLSKVRGDLEWTLRSFAQKRREHIAEEQAKRGGDNESLSARLLAALAPQAARHGFDLGPCAARARP